MGSMDQKQTQRASQEKLIYWLSIVSYLFFYHPLKFCINYFDFEDFSPIIKYYLVCAQNKVM